MQAVDTVANNLANADTLGFKKDLPTFKEYLSAQEREPQPEDIRRGPIREQDLHKLDGRDQSFVVVDGTYTDFRPGTLRVTQAPLDVAMDGPGFIEVSTPTGVRYTRQGSLKLAMDGRLVTSEGHPVLAAQAAGLAGAQPAQDTQPQGQGGPAALATQGGVAAGRSPAEVARYINLGDLSNKGARITIAPGGEIYAGEEQISKLNVVEFQDLNKLRKTGSSLFENKDPANVVAPMRTMVRQGVLETSNVNPVAEMTELIRANRLFEHDMKTLKTYGDILGREANDIGKL